MSLDYIGFNRDFVNDICTLEKTKTLRYQMGHRLPKAGDVVDAVVSHDEGPFARLEVTDVYEMTVGEVINTEFDGHQNYKSLAHFNERMNEYYDEEFTEETVLHMIEFDVVEDLREA